MREGKGLTVAVTAVVPTGVRHVGIRTLRGFLQEAQFGKTHKIKVVRLLSTLRRQVDFDAGLHLFLRLESVR